jgi:hypothetical protein
MVALIFAVALMAKAVTLDMAATMAPRHSA